MTAGEIREKFLRFFKERGHSIIPSASLMPENDPSVLFTTAGMQPLVPYLLGEPHPAGARLAGTQKCLRTDDIDEVGDGSHLTFFEMLGNWSLGDYWKRETIEWSFEFLTGNAWLGIPKEKLAISIFAGDNDAPRDLESEKIWRELGIPEARIAALDKTQNWWPAGGKNPGPQGPDTEMFYWTGDGTAPAKFDPQDSKWVEIWNDVFMEFNRAPDGKLLPLPQKNVDTGMGLERTTAVLQNKKTVFETDLFRPLISEIERLVGKRHDEDEDVCRRTRIISDHLRAVTFILGDPFGVAPSNKDQGYIARRLLRRAVVHGARLGIKGFFLSKIAEIVIQNYGAAYPELSESRDKIISEMDMEEQKFHETLQKGIKKVEGALAETNSISGEAAFELYATYGFPLDLTRELVLERTNGKGSIDETGFEKRFKEHQEISRAGAEQKFAGGLADHSKEVIKGHTATHLLHEALRKVLGEHVVQKGSNITRERLRFDFSHSEKLTPEEIKRVEDLVNEQIKQALPVHFEILDMDEAKRRGAIGFFDDKYAQLGGKIKVYFVGSDEKGYFSKEICGGPHVSNTSEIGAFKIIKEEAVARGIRRIKAITGSAA